MENRTPTKKRPPQTFSQKCKSWLLYGLVYGGPVAAGFFAAWAGDSAVAAWKDRPFDFQEASVDGAVVGGIMGFMTFFGQKVIEYCDKRQGYQSVDPEQISPFT